ncbi:phosphotransferase [Streptosporangium sp. G11]|uniref:phosphotransferase n=1 Tax=Streptosporangium sp. G11 TaxID=3436926 RepID=UPI003EBB6A0E
MTVKAAALLRHAEALLAEAPAEYGRYGPLVKALNPGELDGAALLHADLHAGNLLVDGDRCRVVDWSMACQGAPPGRCGVLHPADDRRRPHAR